MKGNRGFWIVAAMLFVPLIVIVVLQFTSDENRYISPAEAKDIALERGIEGQPDDLTITFDQDPPGWTKTSATWDVSTTNEAMGLRRVIIDAETGKVLANSVAVE